MKLSFTVRHPGRKKAAFLADRVYFFEPPPQTLRELLASLVRQELRLFRERVAAASCFENGTGNRESFSGILIREEAQTREELHQTGRVGFGMTGSFRGVHEIPDEEEAVRTAVLAFEDGLFRVFGPRGELTELDGPLSVFDGETLTFVRLTFLAGSLS